MKVNKVYVGLACLVASGLLAGCGTNHSSSNGNSSKQEVSQSSKKSSSTSKKANTSKSSNDESHSASSSSSIDTNVTDQQIGVMAYMHFMPQSVSAISDGDMFYNPGDDGYMALSTHGDGSATLQFKRDGDQVSVKYMDTNSGTTVADSPIVTKSISLKELENNYYSSSTQKDQVNQYVSKLKDGTQDN